MSKTNSGHKGHRRSPMHASDAKQDPTAYYALEGGDPSDKIDVHRCGPGLPVLLASAR